MQFSLAVSLLTSTVVVGTTSAFQVPSSHSSRVVSPLRVNDVVDALDTDVISNLRPIYDPLSLYADDSPEREMGNVVASEPDINVLSAVTDPLNIYPKGETVDVDAIMSESLPFMTRPIVLNGELAGDAGFDPLGFASTTEKLMTLREAEVKHSRLAMLAAAGWPLSELFDKQIAHSLHLKPLLGFGDKVPSLLNGGLTKVSPVYWGVILAMAGGIELFSQKRKDEEDYSFPGNLNFDPLGLYPKDKAGQMRMQLSEIKNGRLAMLAIFGFAVQEAVTKIGVVNATPFFFHPINEYLEALTNNGYA